MSGVTPQPRHPLAGASQRITRALESPLRLWPTVVEPLDSGLNTVRESAAARRLRLLFASRHALIALLLYAIGACIMQSHALFHLGFTISGNLEGDPTQYMWSMWWWPHAILSGINPFVTHAIWVPDAYNLGSVTSTPLPSILFAPLNALIGWNSGPIVSYNLCNMLAPVISAFFAYRLCLYLSEAPAASIVGGWLYGFSAYGLAQLQGHMNLVFTFLPVVLVLLSLQRLDAVISRRRYVVLAAVAVAAQIGIGTEIVFTTTCLLAVATGAALVMAPAETRRRIIRVLIPELALGYVLAAVVCAPYLYYALTGPEVEANYNSILKVADLVSYFVPTQIFRIGANRFMGVSGAFPSVSGVAETGTYLGLPLIAGAFWFTMSNWRHWATRVLIVVVVVAFVWSLGPTLIVDGTGTVTLPWKLLDTVHPFNEITPVRIGLYVELCASVTFALWLAKRTRRSVLKWVIALAAMAALFPNVNGVFSYGQPIYAERMWSSTFITKGLYKKYLTHNEVVLPIPFGPFGNSLLWQAQARGYFREASGWFGYYPKDYAKSQVMAQLLSFTSFTDPVRLTRRFLISHDVGAVMILATDPGPWPGVMQQIGLKEISVGGVLLFDVPKDLKSLPLPPQATTTTTTTTPTTTTPAHTKATAAAEHAKATATRAGAKATHTKSAPAHPTAG